MHLNVRTRPEVRTGNTFLDDFEYEVDLHFGKAIPGPFISNQEVVSRQLVINLDA